jgi:hypothetical protein
MSYLVYCVFRSTEQEMPQPPPGVGRQPVGVVAQEDLRAVVSRFLDPGLVSNFSNALAYETVVEWFRGYQTVIPMRYGSLFEDCSQIRQLLEERRQQFQLLLGELEGLVEMGVRILLDGACVEMHNHAVPVWPQSWSSLPGSGTAYLVAKRNHYAVLDSGSSQRNEIADRIRAQLSGLFVRTRTESSASADGRLLSLYFLVPSPAVESFSQAVRSIRQQLPGKLLLTGPWPPYNFVDCPPALEAKT